MKHIISLGLGLMLLWILLSGFFTPLLLSFGVFSVVMTLWLSVQLKVIDAESLPVHLVGSLLRFWLILAKRVVVANIDVSLRILGFRPIEPHLVKLPFQHTEDLSKVIYANAITLTPGSASVDIEGNILTVHTISREGAEALEQGDMLDIVPYAEYDKQPDKEQTP